MTDPATIAALATAPAPAGIAIIRLSGPKTRNALKALFRSHHDPVSDPRRLVFGDLVDHTSGDVIDKALAVFMPAPFSYTGEDVGEFQFHGSPLLVEKMLHSLFSFGITPAEPGEFTKRAFLNGKLDLVQAEAVADLISATTSQALRLAGEQLKGRFSHAVAEIGEPLRNALAEVEASIDFPEEDIAPQKIEALLGIINVAFGRIDQLLSTYSYGHLVKEGFRVLLCGRPNVGKSSILNLLLGKERAIVTDISGTTRDLIEEEATLGGYRFIFCDSAGITDTTDTVEKRGIELAREKIEWADLVMFVVDATDKDRKWEETLNTELRGKANKIWMITNKMDLNPEAITTIFCDSKTCEQNFYISATSRDGVEPLVRALIEEVFQSVGGAETSSVLTNERHRNCLLRAGESLSLILRDGKTLPLEIFSAELRACLSALDELVGQTKNEDILGRIFSRFCIGK